MPRKAAAPAAPADDSVPTEAPAAEGDSQPARRSSRLAGRDKPQLPKKAPAKPRGKKAAAAAADDEKQDGEAEAKPKSGRGKKRTVADKAVEESAQPEDEEAPPAKKVVFHFLVYPMQPIN